MKRGEVWWADLGAYRPREQRGRRPVVIWQSDTLTNVLQSVLVIPLTSNLERANLAGTALISASEEGLSEDSVPLLSSCEPFQNRHSRQESECSLKMNLMSWSSQRTRHSAELNPLTMPMTRRRNRSRLGSSTHDPLKSSTTFFPRERTECLDQKRLLQSTFSSWR